MKKLGPLFLVFWLSTLCFCLHALAMNGEDPSWPPAGLAIRCPIVRDTFVSAVGRERSGNNGRAGQLKVKGQQEYTIFDIDSRALRGKIITGALLHVRSASPWKAPLMRVGISTLASEWVEGSSRGYYPEVGSSCFTQARYGQKNWSYAGSTLMDVVFGHGHTIWRFADCTRPDRNGWQTCAVEPDVVAARAAGLSFGFCMADEVGHVWSLKDHRFKYTWFPNRFFYSREKGDSGPWLEVWVNGTDSAPPEPISSLEVKTDGFPPGEALVTWETPEDKGGGRTIGFLANYAKEGEAGRPVPRYLIPMAGQAGQRVRMHIHGLDLGPGDKVRLAIRPVDSSGNIGKAIVKVVRLSPGKGALELPDPGIRPFSPNTELPCLAGLKVAVVDLLDKIDPINGYMIPLHKDGYKGGNHIFSAKKGLVRLQAARNEAVAFQVNLEGRADDVSAAILFEHNPGLKVKIFQFAYVRIRDKNGKVVSVLPDPLIPLKGSFSIPSRAGKVRIRNQKNHSIICEIYVPHNEAPGRKSGVLVISCRGKRLELKIDLTVWNFTLPNKLSFIPEMNAYGTVSPFKGYDYYRLAHEHRTCLNRLPYNWGGRPSFAPGWDGEHFDWSKWDEMVGPLLDGSAFKGLPREGEPVDVLYLPFNENWPVNIFEHYRPSYWADNAFTKRYREDLKKAFSEFARHCDAMGWHDTIFQFYLNNKIYYKKQFWGTSAPWIFDEPVNTQDFWALRWYGVQWHHAVDPVKGLTKMWFRADISYTQFARNTLWGIADIEYLGGMNPQKVRMKREEGMLLGRKAYFSEYGSPNRVKDPNIQPVLWCLSAWCDGAIGVLPWQTIGGKGCWQAAQQTALFYPDNGGPRPSVRLKAFRRGQQDVEYLTLLCQTYGYPAYVVADWLKKNIPMKVGLSQGRVDPMVLWKMRCKTGEAISKKAPGYKRNLVKMVRPKLDAEELPEVGYVSVGPKVRPYAPDASNI